MEEKEIAVSEFSSQFDLNDSLSWGLPTFLRRLADPSIKNVFISGCGGGFDFCHSLALYPELKRLKKNIIIGSYSFGNPNLIKGEAPVVFEEQGAVVRRVTAKSIPHITYGPEVLMCSYLDAKFPGNAPHFAYAYYARSFTPTLLHKLYTKFVKDHEIDAVVIFDGGSDSLMAGDEEGLGDPIEDCTSVTAVAALENVKCKILIDVGFGADRFNHVSDASSLRAIAELTSMNGFLGSFSLESTSIGYKFYKEGIEFMYKQQSFRSVLTSLILDSSEGVFGFEIPKNSGGRVKKGDAFLWPLMAIIWGFDVEVVAKRSLLSKWIKDCKTVSECYYAMKIERLKLEEEGKLRSIEELPSHKDMRF